MPDIICPSCRRRYAGDPKLDGKRIRCMACQAMIDVPVSPFSVPIATDDNDFEPSRSAAPSPITPVNNQHGAVEHLRVIRCYVGWLLAIAAVPAVLGVLAAALWLFQWFVAWAGPR
jgi:hypothetical protein